MGKDAFLQLLVAQLKNQDPLAPSDGKEMAAQLAQFSNVEQLVTVNDTLAQIRDALRQQGGPPRPQQPA
jgi:flagellar basal-body rod modification protein FlgD